MTPENVLVDESNNSLHVKNIIRNDKINETDNLAFIPKISVTHSVTKTFKNMLNTLSGGKK